MGLADKIARNRRVLGIDASTKSVAFGIIDNEILTDFGQIALGDGDLFHRLAIAKQGLEGIVNAIDIDAVDACYIESAVKINNIKTTINLSYMYGIIIATIVGHGIPVKEVTPITWQNFIGNKRLTKEEVAAIVEQKPNASKSYIYNKSRNIRKQRTIDWVKDTFGVEIQSDDIADALGLSYYGVYHG